MVSDEWNATEEVLQYKWTYLQRKEKDKELLQEEGRFTELEIKRLRELAKKVIPEKFSYYARLMGVSYGRITIRKQKSR